MIELEVWASMNPSSGMNGDGHHGEHLVAVAPIAYRNYKRDKGDALCQRRHRFWHIFHAPEREPNCRRCLTLATRLAKREELRVEGHDWELAG